MVTGEFLRPTQPKAQFADIIAQGEVRFRQYFLKPRDDWFGVALQDGLVNLCFQDRGVGSRWMQRSEKRRGPWQIAIGLGNACFIRKSIGVIRYDIENLAELSQRFWKRRRQI